MPATPNLMMRRTSVEVHDEFAVALRALQVHVRKRATDEAQDAPVLPERVAREDADRPASRLIGQPVQHDATEAARLPFVREEQADLGGLTIGAAASPGRCDR